jgi:hypothetical protein
VRYAHLSPPRSERERDQQECIKKPKNLATPTQQTPTKIQDKIKRTTIHSNSKNSSTKSETNLHPRLDFKEMNAKCSVLGHHGKLFYFSSWQCRHSLPCHSHQESPM